MLEQANEVQEVLGRSYGLPEDVDEEDLEAGGNCVKLRRSCSRIRYPVPVLGIPGGHFASWPFSM